MSRGEVAHMGVPTSYVIGLTCIESSRLLGPLTVGSERSRRGKWHAVASELQHRAGQQIARHY
jgi:hypothetical protein